MCVCVCVCVCVSQGPFAAAKSLAEHLGKQVIVSEDRPVSDVCVCVCVCSLPMCLPPALSGLCPADTSVIL